MLRMLGNRGGQYVRVPGTEDSVPYPYSRDNWSPSANLLKIYIEGGQPLENGFRAPIKYMEREFESVNHAWAYAQSNHPNLKRHDCNASHSSYEKKKWAYVQRDGAMLAVMRELLALKFTPNNLRQALIDTADSYILCMGHIHGTGRFWGNTGQVGDNHFGILLMELRDQLIGRNRILEVYRELTL